MSMYAVSIKINSIQEYIFHSNKLKENIGASQITDQEIFHVIMKDVLGEASLQKNSIADIGGGGALVTFDSETIAIEFIRKFSRKLLLNFPGLKTTFAFKSNFNFIEDNIRLKETSVNNKNIRYLNTTVQKHGITADCPFSNESAEDFYANKYISKVSSSKIIASDKSLNAYQQIFDKYSNYTLTTNIENLGQNDEASYIAVVHIDGNGMGSKFGAINSLDDLKAKSVEVQKKTKNAMNLLLEDLVLKFENGSLKEMSIKKEGNKVVLPIRPLLSGGDDITFICEGRLGIYLAEKFIQHFTDNGKSNLMDGACAGVALVKTKYPFYKAYHLAEELCKEAKEKARGSKDSYLSYYYSATTFSGSLSQLRHKAHQLSNGSFMNFGPYNIFADGTKADSITAFKVGIKHFKNDNFPKNKAMALRDVIAESPSSQELFLKQIHESRLTLPDNLIKIWDHNKTPFFDQIELMDFYLTDLL